MKTDYLDNLNELCKPERTTDCQEQREGGWMFSICIFTPFQHKAEAPPPPPKVSLEKEGFFFFFFSFWCDF